MWHSSLNYVYIVQRYDFKSYIPEIWQHIFYFWDITWNQVFCKCYSVSQRHAWIFHVHFFKHLLLYLFLFYIFQGNHNNIIHDKIENVRILYYSTSFIISIVIIRMYCCRHLRYLYIKKFWTIHHFSKMSRICLEYLRFGEWCIIRI